MSSAPRRTSPSSADPVISSGINGSAAAGAPAASLPASPARLSAGSPFPTLPTPATTWCPQGAGLVGALPAALIITVVAGATGGCSWETYAWRGIAEVQGGASMSKPILPLPRGSLRPHGKLEVDPVEVSADSCVMPPGVPETVRANIINDLKGTGLFPGDRGRTLVVRTRLVCHWICMDVIETVMGPFSDLVGRVDFLERSDDGTEVLLGSSFVRGYSTAVVRRTEHDLAGGFARAVKGIVLEAKMPRKFDPPPPATLGRNAPPAVPLPSPVVKRTPQRSRFDTPGRSPTLPLGEPRLPVGDATTPPARPAAPTPPLAPAGPVGPVLPGTPPLRTVPPAVPAPNEPALPPELEPPPETLGLRRPGALPTDQRGATPAAGHMPAKR